MVSPIKISMSALNVEWQRLSIIAENLANMNTSRTQSGGVYEPKRLVSGPAADFQTVLAGGKVQNVPQGVRVIGVESMASGLRREYAPDHPHADPDGFVTYPKIDHAAEMTLMIRTSRSYEANLTAISIAQQMYSRALEIGRQT